MGWHALHDAPFKKLGSGQLGVPRAGLMQQGRPRSGGEAQNLASSSARRAVRKLLKALAAGTVLLAYVGSGKGKTTAGLGLLLRAWGHGMRVLAAFMMKTPRYMGEEVGELKALRRLGIGVVTLDEFGSPSAMFESILEVLDEYDVVLLDEFNYAVRQGLLEPSDVLRLARARAHAILTGNYVWQELYAADMISEVRLVKHYYPKRVAVRGLDW